MLIHIAGTWDRIAECPSRQKLIPGRKPMTFIVNNREYQKPRRVKSWTAVGLGVAMMAALVAISVRIWF
jgi:hypothetical protein